METRCPWGVLWPGDVQGYPLLLFPLPLARWLMKASATGRWEHRLLRPLGQRVAKRNAWKEELVKCVLATQFSLAPAPRESAVKSAPHPAAPVGAPSQTRRHHLTPTPVQRLCTYVQSCDQAPFSLPPGAAHSLFGAAKKRMGGAPPAGTAPLAGASLPRPTGRPRGVPQTQRAPPCYFSSNTDTYTVPVTSNPSLAFT